MAITGMNIDKFHKFGWRFFDLLKKYVKEHRENMEGADMSQFQSQCLQAPIDVAGQDEVEENYIDSEDDEDFAQTGERSEYFASGSANFQPPGMSQAQRALMEQVAGATGGSSSKATSGARVKKAYSAGPRRGTKRAGGASGSSTRRKSSGGKRFSAGSAASEGGAAGRGGRSAGGGRSARGSGRGSASIIRPMS